LSSGSIIGSKLTVPSNASSKAVWQKIQPEAPPAFAELCKRLGIPR
jgi:hypothetical protein